jgi:hypothetical protein
MIILVPWRFSKSFTADYINWLRGKISGARFWLLSIFGGFLCVKMRLTLLPMWLQAVLCGAALLPMVGPIAFFGIEGRVAALSGFGYMADGKAVFAVWGAAYGWIYIGIVLLPVTLVASSIALRFKAKWLHVFDAVALGAELAGTGWVFYRYFSMTVGILWAALSPGMLGVPVVVYVSLAVVRCRKTSDQAGSSSNGLLSGSVNYLAT